MTYSESESDFSFAINSGSDFDSAFKSYSNSESESESDFSSVFMNLDICIFFILYLHSSKQTCRWFFYPFSWQNQQLYKQCKYNAYFLLAYHYPNSLFLSCFQACLMISRFAIKFNAQYIINHIPNLLAFFPHFIIFDQKIHVFTTIFKVFDVSTHLR